MAESILNSNYGLGDLNTSVTIFKALGELLEVDIDMSRLKTIKDRMRACDRIAEAMVAINSRNTQRLSALR